MFAVLALLATIAHGSLLTIERPVSESIRGESLVDLFNVVTAVGGTEVAILAALVVATLTSRRCRTFAVVYPSTLVVGALANVGLKELIGRPRPPLPNTGVALASFPSGHTLQATLLLGLLPLAVYLLAGRGWAFRATVVASALGIVAVGLSRIYLGAHWPTDVIGGALVGAGLILAAEWTLCHPRAHANCDCVLAAASRSARLPLHVRLRVVDDRSSLPRVLRPSHQVDLQPTQPDQLADPDAGAGPRHARTSRHSPMRQLCHLISPLRTRHHPSTPMMLTV